MVGHRFHTFPGVSAHLSDETLSGLLDDDAVEAIEADCILAIDDGDDLIIVDPVDDDNGQAQSVANAPPWGLDRIDSR